MMRCVVLCAALFMLTPTASRADSDVLSLDTGLLQEVVDSVTSHGGERAGQQAMAGMPFVMALPAQNSGGGARNLPPQLSGVGIGLQLGAPTAITVKFGGVQENGFVVGVGVGFSYYRGYYASRFASLSIHADYLIHLATLARTDQLAFTIYAGPGLWLSLFGDGYGFGLGRPWAGAYYGYFGVGLRVPVGVSMSIAQAPIEIYLELDPAIFIFPAIDFGLGASLGFRWHF